MSKPSYIEGDYTWSATKRKLYGRLRCVIIIKKNGEMIGHICKHPKAKKLVFNSGVAETKDTMGFAIKMMDRFYYCIKIDRLLKEQGDE